MERLEFIERVKEIVGLAKAKDNKLSIEWETGGAEGGNCWGDEAEVYYCHNPAPKFKDLEVVLEVLAPKLTLVQYNEIEQSCVHDSRCSEEYYGNYRNYVIKFVNLDELYNQLTKQEVLWNEQNSKKK